MYSVYAGLAPGQRVCCPAPKEGMMGIVKDDFYVEDESPEDVQRAWDSGEPVLVIPSRLRCELRGYLAR